MRVLAYLLANGLAVYVLSRVIPSHVSYTSTEAIVIFSIVLGLLNASVRPILHIITFPLACLTLGLFTVVVNAAVFYLAGRLSSGIQIDALGSLVGTITVSVITGVLLNVFREQKA